MPERIKNIPNEGKVEYITEKSENPNQEELTSIEKGSQDYTPITVDSNIIEAESLEKDKLENKMQAIFENDHTWDDIDKALNEVSNDKLITDIDNDVSDLKQN